MSGITTKKNRRKSSLIITELPSPTNKIIVQDEPMAKDGIMEKPDASSENKMISDKNPTKETLPSKLPVDNEKGTDITKTENALSNEASTKTITSIRGSYYSNLNDFNASFKKNNKTRRKTRRPTRKAPISPDKMNYSFDKESPPSSEKKRRPTRSVPNAPLNVSPIKISSFPPNSYQNNNNNTYTSPKARWSRALSIIRKRNTDTKTSSISKSVESSLDNTNQLLMNQAKFHAAKFNDEFEKVMKKLDDPLLLSKWKKGGGNLSEESKKSKKMNIDIGNKTKLNIQQMPMRNQPLSNFAFNDELYDSKPNRSKPMPPNTLFKAIPLSVNSAKSVPLPSSSLSSTNKRNKYSLIEQAVGDILASKWSFAIDVEDLKKLGHRHVMPWFCHNIDYYWDMIKKVHEAYSLSKYEMEILNLNIHGAIQMDKKKAIQFAKDYDIVPRLLKLKEFEEILNLLVGRSNLLIKKHVGLRHKYQYEVKNLKQQAWNSATTSPNSMRELDHLKFQRQQQMQKRKNLHITTWQNPIAFQDEDNSSLYDQNQLGKRSNMTIHSQNKNKIEKKYNDRLGFSSMRRGTYYETYSSNQKNVLRKKHRTRSTILTDEYGRVVGDHEPDFNVDRRDNNNTSTHQGTGNIYIANDTINNHTEYEDQIQQVLRRSEHMHNETFSQAVARNYEADSRKTFDAWMFGKILYVCAEVALQKGKFKNIFPNMEERIDGFFTMVPGVANESLLNAAITKRKFEIPHIRYL